MVALPGRPPGLMSEAAESWPGLLQLLPPTMFCLKKKERKNVGEARGRGQNKREKQRRSVEERSPGWG